LPPPDQLAPNPVASPDLEKAEHHEMVFEGGAMGTMAQAEYKGKVLGFRSLVALGLVWTVNGRAIPPMREGDPGDPMLSLRLGQTYRLTWTNNTSFDHPIHLHGHSFHLLSRNGKNLDRPMIMDTVLIPPGEAVDVAFVADNPGDWALHCHVLEHAEAGMMGYVRVS
jgi:FtsP/CotA-like multicopper oxidase with cupredoxin domain